MTYDSADLRAWRARERLTQAKCAELFGGVSQRTVALWESGGLPRDFAQRFDKVLTDYYKKAS